MNEPIKNYEIIFKHYLSLLRERMALFYLYLFIATTLSIGAFYSNPKYGVCDNLNERTKALIGLGVLILIVSVIFILMMCKNHYFIRKSRIALSKLEKEEKNKLYTYFSRENNHCYFNHGCCFFLLIALTMVTFIIMLGFIWYKPECSSQNQPQCVKCNQDNIPKLNINLNISNK